MHSLITVTGIPSFGSCGTGKGEDGEHLSEHWICLRELTTNLVMSLVQE